MSMKPEVDYEWWGALDWLQGLEHSSPFIGWECEMTFSLVAKNNVAAHIALMVLPIQHMIS